MVKLQWHCLKAIDTNLTRSTGLKSPSQPYNSSRKALHLPNNQHQPWVLVLKVYYKTMYCHSCSKEKIPDLVSWLMVAPLQFSSCCFFCSAMQEECLHINLVQQQLKLQHWVTLTWEENTYKKPLSF